MNAGHEERPQILEPEELVQTLRTGKRGGGWRLSRKAATELVAAQYDMWRLSSAQPEAREGVMDALDFASQIETALAKGAWKHTELANRIEMYAESRLAAQKDEGQLDEALSLLGELISYDNFEAYPPYMQERVKDFMSDKESAAPEPRPAEEPAPVVSHDAADTIHNAGSVSHDNREPDGRKGE